MLLRGELVELMLLVIDDLLGLVLLVLYRTLQPPDVVLPDCGASVHVLVIRIEPW